MTPFSFLAATENQWAADVVATHDPTTGVRLSVLLRRLYDVGGEALIEEVDCNWGLVGARACLELRPRIRWPDIAASRVAFTLRNFEVCMPVYIVPFACREESPSQKEDHFVNHNRLSTAAISQSLASER